jgi:hypothetical protein
MSDLPDTIFYDGSARPRAEVAARVEADIAAFLARCVGDLEGDDDGWQALLEGVARALPLGLDAEDLGTFDRGVRVRAPRSGVLLVSMAPRLSQTLAALYEAVRARPWCAAARLDAEAGEITVELGPLAPADEDSVARSIDRRAEAMRASMRRGVDALERIVAREPVPTATKRLDDALAAVDRALAVKLARLRRVT